MSTKQLRRYIRKELLWSTAAGPAMALVFPSGLHSLLVPKLHPLLVPKLHLGITVPAKLRFASAVALQRVATVCACRPSPKHSFATNRIPKYNLGTRETRELWLLKRLASKPTSVRQPCSETPEVPNG